MRASGSGRGYTLMEVLVTVALLTLMMGILSTVLVTATGTVRTHRSLSEMDQKARAIALLLTRDLQQMYIQDDADGWPPKPPVDAGYLAYGERSFPQQDTLVDTDDWIQWTAFSAYGGEIGAVETYDDSGTSTPTDDKGSVDADTTIPRNAAGDGLVSSTLYEVAWYLRPDRITPNRYLLHRRVILVGDRVQPQRNDRRLLESFSDVTPAPFRDLDLRHRRWTFWGATDGSSGGPILDSAASHADGRRYRPSLQQTSDPAWPLTPYNWLTASADPDNWNSQTQYTNGTRTGQDVLARDVISFDVKFWDPQANGGQGLFVDIGSGAPGAVTWNAGSSPDSNVYDTWSTDYAGAPPYGNNFPRAIQIRIRLADPYGSEANPAREVTVVVDLMKR